MNDDFLKLTTYFGERDRSGGRFLADELIDLYERSRSRRASCCAEPKGSGVSTGSRPSAC